MNKIEEWLENLPLQTLTDELKQEIIDAYSQEFLNYQDCLSKFIINKIYNCNKS